MAMSLEGSEGSRRYLDASQAIEFEQHAEEEAFQALLNSATTRLHQSQETSW